MYLYICNHAQLAKGDYHILSNQILIYLLIIGHTFYNTKCYSLFLFSKCF